MIDSRKVAFDVVAKLAISGPMIAVGEDSSAPPWTALSYAPLAVVAAAYRAAGAEVWNLDLAEPAAVEAPHGCGRS